MRLYMFMYVTCVCQRLSVTSRTVEWERGGVCLVCASVWVGRGSGSEWRREVRARRRALRAGCGC